MVDARRIAERYLEQRRMVKGSLKERKLTDSQFQCLLYIGSRTVNSENKVPLDLNETVKKTTSSKSRISVGLSNLMRKGYLEKEIDLTDQRKVNVALTKKGARLYSELTEILEGKI